MARRHPALDLASARAAAAAGDPRTSEPLDASVRLLRSHEAWFDRRRTTAGALAAELELRTLRVPADARDATMLAYHPAFSGHLVEIVVGRGGVVRYVGLLG